MQSSLRQLVTGSERATRLVNQLLLLARAENPAAIGLARTDLNAIAYEQAMHWVPHALSLSTDLGFEGAETPVEINGNPLLLAELLNNLVDNALRYARAAISRCGCRAWASKACLRSRTRAPASRRKNASGSSTASTACWARCPTQRPGPGDRARDRADPPGHGRHQRPSSPYSDLPGTRIRVAFPLYSEPDPSADA